MTLSYVGSAADDYGATVSYTFTPVADAIYIAIHTWSQPTTHSNLTPSFSAGGANFSAGPTEISHNNASTHDWHHGIRMWKMQAVASPSGTSTIGVTSTSGVDRLAIVELTGYDYTNLFVQEKKASSDNPASLTLDAATDVANSLLTVYCFDCDPDPPSIDGGEGTEIADLGLVTGISSSDPATGIYHRTASTSTTVAIAAAAGGTLVAITAIELAVPSTASFLKTESGAPLGIEGGGALLL